LKRLAISFFANQDFSLRPLCSIAANLSAENCIVTAGLNDFVPLGCPNVNSHKRQRVVCISKNKMALSRGCGHLWVDAGTI